MGFYGYDPARFIEGDYGIAAAGQQLGQTISQIPEWQERQRQIKAREQATKLLQLDKGRVRELWKAGRETAMAKAKEKGIDPQKVAKLYDKYYPVLNTLEPSEQITHWTEKSDPAFQEAVERRFLGPAQATEYQEKMRYKTEGLPQEVNVPPVAGEGGGTFTEQTITELGAPQTQEELMARGAERRKELELTPEEAREAGADVLGQLPTREELWEQQRFEQKEERLASKQAQDLALKWKKQGREAKKEDLDKIKFVYAQSNRLTDDITAAEGRARQYKKLIKELQDNDMESASSIAAALGIQIDPSDPQILTELQATAKAIDRRIKILKRKEAKFENAAQVMEDRDNWNKPMADILAEAEIQTPDPTSEYPAPAYQLRPEYQSTQQPLAGPREEVQPQRRGQPSRASELIGETEEKPTFGSEAEARQAGHGNGDIVRLRGIGLVRLR